MDPGRRLTGWGAVLAMAIATWLGAGCVASFHGGPHVALREEGEGGAGFTLGGSGGALLPRGALVAGTRMGPTWDLSGGDGNFLQTWEVRWLDDPGPWSPRLGLGVASAWPLMGVTASVGLSRALFRSGRGVIALGLELTAGHLWDDNNRPSGWFGMLSLPLLLESWPERGESVPEERPGR